VAHQGKDSESKQDASDGVPNGHERERSAEKDSNHDYAANCQRMAKRDRDKRFCYGAPSLLLHPQCHREKPPHPGVYSVVGTQEQHDPQRRRTDFGVHHFSSE
jgi:hypothetical protein